MAAHATAPASDDFRHSISIEDSFVWISVTAKTLGLTCLVLRNATKSATKTVWLLGARMAIGALDLTVGTVDDKARPVLVVELGMIELRPGLGLVARRTFAARLRVEHDLTFQECVAVRVLVTVFTAHRCATETAHVIVVDHLVARDTVLLRVLTGQRQSRLCVHRNVERVRYELRARVATDAILRRQRAIVELPTMRIGMARTAIVGTASGMPLGKGTVTDMALRARHCLVRFVEREASVAMMLGRDHETGVIEVLMVQRVARDTA